MADSQQYPGKAAGQPRLNGNLVSNGVAVGEFEVVYGSEAL